MAQLSALEFGSNSHSSGSKWVRPVVVLILVVLAAALVLWFAYPEIRKEYRRGIVHGLDIVVVILSLVVPVVAIFGDTYHKGEGGLLYERITSVGHLALSASALLLFASLAHLQMEKAEEDVAWGSLEASLYRVESTSTEIRSRVKDTAKKIDTKVGKLDANLMDALGKEGQLFKKVELEAQGLDGTFRSELGRVEQLSTQVARETGELGRVVGEVQAELVPIFESQRTLAGVTDALSAKTQAIEEGLNEQGDEMESQYGAIELWLSEHQEQMSAGLGSLAEEQRQRYDSLLGEYGSLAAEVRQLRNRFDAQITEVADSVLTLGDAISSQDQRVSDLTKAISGLREDPGGG